MRALLFLLVLAASPARAVVDCSESRGPSIGPQGQGGAEWAAWCRCCGGEPSNRDGFVCHGAGGEGWGRTRCARGTDDQTPYLDWGQKWMGESRLDMQTRLGAGMMGAGLELLNQAGGDAKAKSERRRLEAEARRKYEERLAREEAERKFQKTRSSIMTGIKRADGSTWDRDEAGNDEKTKARKLVLKPGPEPATVEGVAVPAAPFAQKRKRLEELRAEIAELEKQAAAEPAPQAQPQPQPKKDLGLKPAEPKKKNILEEVRKKREEAEKLRLELETMPAAPDKGP